MAVGSNDTVATLSAALKTLWPQKKIQTILYKDAPFLGLIPKMTKFTGNNLVLATRYSGQQGRSSKFATAQANRANAAQVAFTLTRVQDYAVGGMTGEAVEAALGSEGSLIDGMNQEMDTSMVAIKRSICQALYGNGGGSIGQISTLVGSVVTLVNRTDIVNWEINTKFEASTADGTSGARKGVPDQATVTNIDRDAGAITFSGAITGLAVADFLFIQDDFGIKMSGLAAWLPQTPPTSTLFFGVDRTPDLTRLGGIRFAATAGAPIEETLQLALARFFEHGALIDHVFMNPVDLNKLTTSMGSKSLYEMVKAPETVTIGYKAVTVIGPGGEVKVFADPSCPAGKAFALTMDTWKLYSLGDAPHLLNRDGLSVRAEATADAYQWRLGLYGQVGCVAPGYNGVITL